MIRVLIADDQALVRGALGVLLNAESDISVVAETGSGSDVVALARDNDVDVALLDIEMPGLNGIEAAAQLNHADLACRSLIVTTFSRPGFLRRALDAGASGFVVKDTPPGELARAIRRVHQGLRVIDPDLAEESLVLPDSPLTEREAEIARLTLTGAETADIAAGLHVSQGTVRNHISSIITKTNARNRFEAARTAESHGWL